MALKNLLETMKQEGYIVKKLDQYLLSLNERDANRRWDINSPSSASRCSMEIIANRLGLNKGQSEVEPRVRRIFDNGTNTHERLQRYMMKQGMLLLDEVPVHLDRLQIQGHTDGLLDLGRKEIGILEIKTINTHGFAKLTEAKQEHKEQASVYLVSLEERRRMLRTECTSEEELREFFLSKEYQSFIKEHYGHLEDGKTFSKSDKLFKKYEIMMKADTILWSASKPITKMVFLYEDKNTQELKEYTFMHDKALWDRLDGKFTYINEWVAKGEMPEEPFEPMTGVGARMCKFCGFKHIGANIY